MPGFRRRLLAVLVPLTVVAVLAAAAVLWLDQQSARARLAEAQLEPALARAEAADARAARAEASLRGRGLHLAGASTWSLTTSPPEQVGPDRTQIQTVERWLYDERDEADQRQRCFVEDSDQTYILRLNDPTTWVVDEIQLGGSHRSDCPSGT